MKMPCPLKSVGSLNLLIQVAKVEKNSRTSKAMQRAADEVHHYAHRNAMEVLAEQVIDVDYDFSEGERGKYADR